MERLLRYQRVLLLEIFLLMIPLGSNASARHHSVPLLGPQIGFIRLGKTSEHAMEKHFGAAQRVTGFHPGSALEWQLGVGGCFKADGEFADGHNSYIVDNLMWRTSPCEAHSSHIARMTFLDLQLNTCEARVKQVLGPHYRRVEAYQRPCLEWVLRTKNGQYLTVYAGFKRIRLSLLSIWLDK